MIEKPRFTGEWPPPETWSVYPNWEYALDEEEVEGQDETTLRPSDNVEYIDADTAYTAGVARLANGQEFPALLEMQSGEIVGLNVFVNSLDAWRVYFDFPNQVWKSFSQEWLPIEERQPTVSLADSSIFPLSVESRLPRVPGQDCYRVVINPDGSTC